MNYQYVPRESKKKRKNERIKKNLRSVIMNIASHALKIEKKRRMINHQNVLYYLVIITHPIYVFFSPPNHIYFKHICTYDLHFSVRLNKDIHKKYYLYE